MKGKLFLIGFVILGLLGGCFPSQKFTYNYYQQNEKALQRIKQQYERLSKDRPFSIEFKDKGFTKIGLEIITDSIRYIYVFDSDSRALTDTLRKYHFDERAVNDLIYDMRQNFCTWITTLDFYEKRQKKHLVFLTIRHKDLTAKWKDEKYFTLAFFSSRQLYDHKNRLLDKDLATQKRSINGEIFYKVNDSIAYAYTGHFR